MSVTIDNKPLTIGEVTILLLKKQLVLRDLKISGSKDILFKRLSSCGDQSQSTETLMMDLLMRVPLPLRNGTIFSLAKGKIMSRINVNQSQLELDCYILNVPRKGDKDQLFERLQQWFEGLNANKWDMKGFLSRIISVAQGKVSKDSLKLEAYLRGVIEENSIATKDELLTFIELHKSTNPASTTSNGK